MRWGMVLIGALLAGCSVSEVSGIMDAKPGEPAPPAIPPYRQMISENLSGVFASSAAPRDIVVSEARPTRLPTGSGWRVCLRASFTGVTGRDTGPLTYVVFLTRSRIEDRRLALPEDQCENEVYAPL